MGKTAELPKRRNAEVGSVFFVLFRIDFMRETLYRGCDMRRFSRIDFGRRLIILIFAAAILAVLPMAALAQPTCSDPNDRDCDGFSNTLEAQGFSLAASTRSYSACPEGVTIDSPERPSCVDSSSPDLFVILKRSSSDSIIEPDLDSFEFIRARLQIAVHEIAESDVFINRVVTTGSTQLALMVQENHQQNFDTTCEPIGPIGDILVGITLPDAGIPPDGRTSHIYTRNIVGRIDYFCKELGPSGTCKDILTGTQGEKKECDLDGGVVTPGELDDLDRLYIRYTIAHEVAHNLNLAAGESDHHHRVRSNYLMEGYVKDPRLSKGHYQWKIPTVFCSNCQAGYQLVAQ